MLYTRKATQRRGRNRQYRVTSVVPVVAAATRLGLFYTAEELAVWRVRAVIGPYNTVNNPVHGGVGTISGVGKGDWERVLYYRDRLVNNVAIQGTTMRLFQNTLTDFDLGYPNNNDRTEPFPNTTDQESNGTIDPYRYRKEPKDEGVALCASAFYALVTKTLNPTDSDLVAQVCKPILLAQVSNEGTQFPAVNTNNTKWNDGLGDTHCWTFTEFMIRYLFAYDYLKAHVLEGGTPLFSTAEKTTMLTWFEKYANLMARNVCGDMKDLFPARLSGDLFTIGYSIAGAAATSGNKFTHINGDGSNGNRIGNSSNYLNNRRSNQSAIIGLTDLVLKEAGYTQSLVSYGGRTATLEFCCKLHFEEFLIVGIYEDGSFGEHQRGSAGDHLKGYHYVWDSIQALVLPAAAYMRAGDDSLVTMSRSRGYYWDVAQNKFILKNGSPKTIFTALEWYVNNVVETNPDNYRYFTDAADAVSFIQPEYRLYHKDGLYEYVREARALLLTHYWKSPKLIAATTRNYQTTRIGSAAGAQDWWGIGEIMPLHFMFAQMENLNPYPATKLFA